MCETMEKYMAESREEGRKEGRKEGRAEGKLEQLVELVKKNLISITDAVNETDMTEQEFRKLI